MPEAADALCSTGQVKDYLKITGATWDALIGELIDGVTDSIQSDTKRKFKQATYTNEDYNGNGTRILILKNYPIISVASLYDDVNRDFGASTLIAAADYIVWKDEGEIELVEEKFTTGVGNVRITYDAGFAVIPQDLRDACREEAAGIFERSKKGKAALGLDSASDEGGSESYVALQDGFLPQTLQVLKRYRRLTIG